MGEKSTITEKEVLDFVWKYFQQHAAQRVSYFNFFVLFASSMAAGMISTFQFKAYILGVAIGLLLSFMSFIFWKFDQRNKYLIKISEKALIELESNFPFNTQDQKLDAIKIFTRENLLTNSLKIYQQTQPFWKRQFSHSNCLNLLFVVFGFIGILSASLSMFIVLTASSNGLHSKTVTVILPTTDTLVVFGKEIVLKKEMKRLGIKPTIDMETKNMKLPPDGGDLKKP